MPTNCASARSKSAVKRPAVSQPSSDESTSAEKSSEVRTLPETGTGSSPGVNDFGARSLSAYLRVSVRISSRSTSSSLVSFCVPSANGNPFGG